MSGIMGFLAGIAWWVWFLLSIAFGVVLWTNKKFRWLWFSFWYPKGTNWLPFPNINNEYSSKKRNQAEIEDKYSNKEIEAKYLVTKAESSVCTNYKDKGGIIDIGRGKFDSAVDYLNAAHDSHQKIISKPIVGLFFVALFIESWFLASVVVEAFLANKSQNEQFFYTIGMAILASFGMGIFAILAASSFRKWRLASYLDDHAADLEKDKKSLSASTYAKSFQDKEESDAQRAFNRSDLTMSGNGNKNVTSFPAVFAGWIALLVLACVFVMGARYSTMSKESAKETIEVQSSVDIFAENKGSDIPDEVKNSANKAEDKAQQDLKDATQNVTIFGLGLYVFIFLVTHVVHFLYDLKHSFLGKASEDAYEATKGFKDYDDYYNHVVVPVANKADVSLNKVRDLLSADESILYAPISDTKGNKGGSVTKYNADNRSNLPPLDIGISFEEFLTLEAKIKARKNSEEEKEENKKQDKNMEKSKSEVTIKETKDEYLVNKLSAPKKELEIESDLEKKLKHAKGLFEKGLIEQSDYEMMKKKIIDEATS
jgi:hypothetical protein